MSKRVVIDMETGEILSEIKYHDGNYRFNKSVVDEMLKKATKVEDLDAKLLYNWCKMTKEINDYNQIKLLGAFRDKETEKKMIEDITITGYTARIIDKAHDFSGMIKSNHKSFASNWEELFEVIGCTSRATQMKLKKFLTSNNIIRRFRIGGKEGQLTNRMILNPFLFRNANYSSQVSIMVYQDFIEEGVNMSTYPVRWLMSLGYINPEK